jgi:hypothetical protein
MFRKKMIARCREFVGRRGAAGPGVFSIAALDMRIDPAIPLQLEKLLPNRFARELERGGKLGNGRRP